MFLSGVIPPPPAGCPKSTALVHRSLVESLTTRPRARQTSHELAGESSRLQEANLALAEEMVGRLKAQEGELVAGRSWRMHFERTPLAVTVGHQQRITAWNPAPRPSSASSEETIGKPCTTSCAGRPSALRRGSALRPSSRLRDGNKATLVNNDPRRRVDHCSGTKPRLVDAQSHSDRPSPRWSRT